MHHNNTNDDDIMTMMEEKNTVRNKKCFNLEKKKRTKIELHWRFVADVFPEILFFRHVIIIIFLHFNHSKKLQWWRYRHYTMLLYFSKVIELDALVFQQWCLYGGICWWVE